MQSDNIVKESGLNRLFHIFLAIFTFIYLSHFVASVNICPVDKNPTEITIEHSRHPMNVPIGIYSNSIDVTVTLNAIDRKTQNKIPLANKEVLIELVIGSKFIGRNANGEFYLSDVSVPFALNTSDKGTVSFTVYTQPPLLEKPTDPRKISYSISASFTPKPKDPVMGSSKTERYVPGVFPVISMAACAPLFIIFAILIAAMFAAGKNPFGLFDFSRVAFKAPGISGGRVTQRVRTTVAGVAAGAAQVGLKSAVKTGLYAVGKKLTPSEEKKATGVMGVLQSVAKLPGRIVMSTVSRRLTKEERQKLIAAEKKAKGKPMSITDVEKALGKNVRVVKGITGEIRIVTAADKVSASGLFEIFKQTFLASLGQLGQRPWSLAYAVVPQIQRPSEQTYTNQEQKEIQEKVKKAYGIVLEKGDVDQYGLTEKGKMRILEALNENGRINQLNEIIKSLKSEKIDPQTLLTIGILKRDLAERAKSKYLTPGQKAELEKQIEMLSILDKDKLIKNLEKIRDKEIENRLNAITSNGALIGFDKERLILDQKINGAAYYSNYGFEEMKSKLGIASLLAEAHGIDLKRIVDAYQSGDPVKINKVVSENLRDIGDDPNRLAAFNYIIKDVQIGTVHRFLDKLEIKDEKGNLITDPQLKVKKFLEMDYGSVENRERLIKNVIQTLGSENKLQTLEKAIKIVNGEKSSVNEQTAYYTVIKGEEVLNERIKALEGELNKVKEKYESPTPGSIGYEKIKAIERKIDEARGELSEVRKAVQNVKSEADNLLLMREIYEKSKINPELAAVASPIPDSIFNMRKIFETGQIIDAIESTNKLKSANLYADQNIDRVSKEITNSVNNLTAEEKRTEVDKKFSEYIEKLNGLIEKYNGIPSRNNMESFQRQSLLNEIDKSTSDSIKDIEYDVKQETPLTTEERTRYNQYIETLNRINKTIEDARKTVEKQIKNHIEINRDNPFVDMIDAIDHSEFDEKGLKPEIIENQLKDKVFGSGTIMYYYSNDDKYKKDSANEQKQWNELFYKKDTVSELKVSKKQ